jgi:hypothetical protein
MANFTIRGDDTGQIDLAPATVADEVARNVAIILGTLTGTCPGYRAFGHDGSYIDRPLPQASVQLRRAVLEAIETWEPRAQVVSIETYRGEDSQERLVPIVTIEVRDDA